jgi:hypothetical protein
MSLFDSASLYQGNAVNMIANLTYAGQTLGSGTLRNALSLPIDCPPNLFGKEKSENITSYAD